MRKQKAKLERADQKRRNSFNSDGRRSEGKICHVNCGYDLSGSLDPLFVFSTTRITILLLCYLTLKVPDLFCITKLKVSKCVGI
jgi:hypothetical protein